MHDPPPSVYENWPAPNYVDPVTRGAALIVINSACCALALLIVFSRVYTRTCITGSFGVDDVFICLALIPSLGLTGCTLASERVFGWNRHIWDATPEQVHGGLMLEFASGLLYIQASLLTKLSVVFFCRRLLSDSHPRWYRRGLDIFAALTFIGNMAYTVTFCFACQPLSAYWDGYAPDWKPDYPYHCINIGMLWLSGSILNASWDLLTWLVPLPIVLQLHLPIKQRIAVIALFAIGLAVVIAGIMKTLYVQEAFNESYDVTWTGYPLWISGALEIDIGILCASVPSLRPLFSHFCPRMGGGGAGAAGGLGGGGKGGRWAMRKSYSRISKCRDIPGEGDDHEATPLSPLSPVHLKLETQFTTDHMKPWSRNRSARSSIHKLDISPVSPMSPLTSPFSSRLTPLSEGAGFNHTPALLPPEDKAIQRHLEEEEEQQQHPEKISLPLSPTSTTFGFNGGLSGNPVSKPVLSTLDTASVKSKNGGRGGTDSPVSRKAHSRKGSSAHEFDGFNFGVAATSSRRTSQGTAPPSYGDFVTQNSFIVEEDRSSKRDDDMSK